MESLAQRDPLGLLRGVQSKQRAVRKQLLQLGLGGIHNHVNSATQVEVLYAAFHQVEELGILRDSSKSESCIWDLSHDGREGLDRPVLSLPGREHADREDSLLDKALLQATRFSLGDDPLRDDMNMPPRKRRHDPRNVVRIDDHLSSHKRGHAFQRQVEAIAHEVRRASCPAPLRTCFQFGHAMNRPHGRDPLDASPKEREELDQPGAVDVYDNGGTAELYRTKDPGGVPGGPGHQMAARWQLSTSIPSSLRADSPASKDF